MAAPRTSNGWVRVDTGESGNVFVFIGIPTAVAEDLPTTDVGTGSIAVSQAGNKYLYHETTGWREMTS